MIDAALPVLMKLGLDEDNIYYDKFTITSHEEEGEEMESESGPDFPGKVE